MLVDHSYIEKNRLAPSVYAPDVKFVMDEVVSVAPLEDNSQEKGEVTLKDATLLYDYLVIASGAHYNPNTFVSPSAIHANNLEDLIRSYPLLQSAENVSIIGAGPVGVEIVSEICEAFPNKNVTLIHSSRAVLSRLNPKAQEYAYQFLSKYPNLRFHLGDPAISVDPQGAVTTASGVKFPSQIAYVCTGLVANTAFLRPHMSNTLASNGFVKVNSFLQSETHPTVFAVGDTANTPEEKLAQGAFSHARIVAQNIQNMENGNALVSYAPPAQIRIGMLLGKSDALIVTGGEIRTGYLAALQKQAISLSASVLPIFGSFLKRGL